MKTSKNNVEICVISQQKWNSINEWILKKERERLEKEKQEIYTKYMRELSQKLVFKRENPRERILKQLEEKDEEDKNEKLLEESYKRYKEEQIKKRDELVEKYKKHHLANQTPTLELNRALRYSAILAERKNQVELNQQVQKKQEELKLKKYEGLHFHSYSQENPKYNSSNFLKNQCEENKKKRHEDWMSKINQERGELWTMREKWEVEKQNLKELEINKKKNLLRTMKQGYENEQLKRLNEKLKDLEDFKLTQVVQNANYIRDSKVEENIRKLRDEKLNKNEGAFKMFLDNIPPVEPDEESIYQNSVQQQRQEFERKATEKKSLLKFQAEEKKRAYQEALKLQQEKAERKCERKQRELLEKSLRNKAIKCLDEIHKKEEIEKKKLYRQELLYQAAELEESKKIQKKLEDDYVLNSFKNDDEIFKNYADEVIKYATEKNWTLEPIKKAIKEYGKKRNFVGK